MQEIVDCTYAWGNKGCYGGIETYSWQYQNTFGAVSAGDYPYVSGYTRNSGTCLASLFTKIGKAETWGMLTGGADAIIT